MGYFVLRVELYWRFCELLSRIWLYKKVDLAVEVVLVVLSLRSQNYRVTVTLPTFNCHVTFLRTTLICCAFTACRKSCKEFVLSLSQSTWFSCGSTSWLGFSGVGLCRFLMWMKYARLPTNSTKWRVNTTNRNLEGRLRNEQITAARIKIKLISVGLAEIVVCRT